MADAPDLVSQQIEREPRREIATVDLGVAFAFGAAEPSAAEVRRLSERFEGIRDTIVGTDKRLTIISRASSPGEEDFNQALSNQRGEWLKGWFADQGVDPNQIQVWARGERDAYQGRDSAYDRVAILLSVEDVPATTAIKPSDFVITLNERFQSVVSDKQIGKSTLSEVLAPFADKMRELHSLPENPIFPDPSANPAEFLKQGGRLIGKLALDFLPRIPFTDVDMPPTSLDDAILDQIKKYPLLDKVKPAAELAAGVASGLARATLTDDVAEQRKPILDAYKQVIAAALDPTYKLDLAGTDASSRALASALYNRLVELPYLDRYRIAIYLALRSDTKDWLGLEERLDGRIFARGADFVLFNSEYRYDSTDPGRHVLFGLSLVIVDGQIKVVDARGQVIGSADVEDTTDQRTGDLSPGSAPAPAGKDDAGPTAPSDMAGTGAFMASDARTIDGGLLFDAPSTAPSPTAKDAVDVDGKPGDAAPANTLPSAGTDDSPGASPLKAPPSDNSPDSYTTQQAQTSDDPPDAYSCPAQTSDDPPDAYTCPAQPSDDPPDAYSTQGAPTRATPEPPPEAIPAAADDGPQPSAPAGGGS